MPGSLPPGSVIGILGGGQLGRMTALAAARLGYRCHIFTDAASDPACQVTNLATLARHDDEAALQHFADGVDVITYEFENIPLAAVRFLAERKPVRPSPDTLAISQHRGAEKAFAVANGIPVSPYRLVTSRDDTARAVRDIGLPAVLKTCRFGYDGKGQAMLRATGDLDDAVLTLASEDMIVEQYVPFEKELSVIVARGIDGSTRPYPTVENSHVDHILARTTAPAAIPHAIAENATGIAVALAGALDLVGLLAVELFMLSDGRLYMNEMAPRPHNSGHWTQDGAATCQFEQLVRAVAGLPLGKPDLLAPTVMRNLIGDDIDEWRSILAEPGARLHLYGKAQTRPGRKMGHVNLIATD